MFSWYPHNELQEEVVAVNRENKDTIEKNSKVFISAIEETPIVFSPHIRFEFF